MYYTVVYCDSVLHCGVILCYTVVCDSVLHCGLVIVFYTVVV